MRVTFPALLVMRQFLMSEYPTCGAELMRATKIGAGTMYNMLNRMLETDWIERAGSLAAPNEPVAHFYRMTPAGRAAFLDMLSRLTIPDHLWRTPCQTPPPSISRTSRSSKAPM